MHLATPRQYWPTVRYDGAERMTGELASFGYRRAILQANVGGPHNHPASQGRFSPPSMLVTNYRRARRRSEGGQGARQLRSQPKPGDKARKGHAMTKPASRPTAERSPPFGPRRGFVFSNAPALTAAPVFAAEIQSHSYHVLFNLVIKRTQTVPQFVYAVSVAAARRIERDVQSG